MFRFNVANEHDVLATAGDHNLLSVRFTKVEAEDGADIFGFTLNISSFHLRTTEPSARSKMQIAPRGCSPSSAETCRKVPAFAVECDAPGVGARRGGAVQRRLS